MKNKNLLFDSMARYSILSFIVIVLISCNVSRVAENGDNQQEEIQHLLEVFTSTPGISISPIDHNQDHFNAAFEVFIEQPLDHKDPSKGIFTQKFYLNHKSLNSPVIFNLNGYSVPNNSFVSELVPWLKANFVHVEHRYFADSKPSVMDYEFLTISFKSIKEFINRKIYLRKIDGSYTCANP